MTKEQQIERMELLINMGCAYVDCSECKYHMKKVNCPGFYIAEHLYDEGFRRDASTQILDDIERFLYMNFRFCKEEIGNDETQYIKGRLDLTTHLQDFIAELRRKYIGEPK